MATVTSFAEFLEAIAGSEEVVLANDLDAGSGEYRSPFTIQCAVDGAGHTITGLSVQGNYGINLASGASLKNLEFVNFLVKSTNNVTLLKGATDGQKITYCKFGALLECGGYAWDFITMPSTSSLPAFNHCAVDLTVQNSSGISGRFPAFGTWTYSNVLIRGADFTRSQATTLGNFTNSAVVLEECQRLTTSSSYGVSFNGTRSYIALRNCNFLSKISGSANSLFCNDGGTATSSGLKAVTAEQLRSEDYLRSIGFLP